MNDYKSTNDIIDNYINEVGESAKKTMMDNLGIEYKNGKYRCPNGHAHKNGDIHFSASWNNDKFYFNCHTCDWNRNIYTHKLYDLKMKFNEIIPKHLLDSTNEKNSTVQTKDNSRKKEVNNMSFKNDLKALNNENRKFLNDRGINDDTLKLFKIVSTKTNYPAFPYFNNKSEIVGLKYRPNWENCKYASFTNSQFNLFGRHLLNKKDKRLFICEGEIDCMILKQVFPTLNIVSVPTGANSIESVWEREKEIFSYYNKLIVIPDNDKAGKNMLIKFENKFGDKVDYIDFKRYKNEKDINDLYLKHGEEAIKTMIRNIIVPGIVDMSEVNIVPEDNFYLDTGYPSLDECLNGIAGGTFSIFCGYTGHGKTTVLEAFANKTVGDNFKVLTIDGEHRQAQKVNNVYLKVLSNYQTPEYIKKIKVHKKYKNFPTEKGQRLCKAWAKGKNYLYSYGDIAPEKRLNNEQMFRLVEKAVKYDGIHMIILDNIMSLNNEMIEGNQFEKQEMFVKRCHSLCKKHNVAVVMCAHMKKPSKDIPTNEYSIFGSSTIPNYADNIIFIKKASDNDKQNYASNYVNGIIQVMKNREEGKNCEIPLTFNIKTKMLYEINLTDIEKAVPYYIDFGLKKYLEDENLVKEIENKDSDVLFSQLGLGSLEDM